MANFAGLYTEEEWSAAPPPTDFSLLYQDNEVVVAPPAEPANFSNLYQAEQEEIDSPSFNVARGFTERIADLTGGFIGVAVDIATPPMEFVEDAIGPLGGFAWEDGDYLPTYLNGEKWTKYERLKRDGKGFFDTLATGLKNFDAGYIPQATWDTVKQEFSEDSLSISAWAEVMEYGFETGVMSLADMGGMVLNFPAYIISRAGEIGDKRAINSGRDEGDLVDTLEAAPFALGSALFDKFGMTQIFKSVGKEGVEQLGKDVIQAGFAKVASQRVAGAVAIEATTEAFQEGVVEYLGERLGTDAAISWQESLDRAAAGAVAGGIAGGGLSAASTTGAAILQPKETIDLLDQAQDEILGPSDPTTEADMLTQMETRIATEGSIAENSSIRASMAAGADYLATVSDPLEVESIAEPVEAAEPLRTELISDDPTADIFELAIKESPEIEELNVEDQEVMNAVGRAAALVAEDQNMTPTETASFTSNLIGNIDELMTDFRVYVHGADEITTIKAEVPVKPEVKPELKKLLGEGYRAELQKMSDDLIKNGDISYVMDADQKIIGRTKSLNPQWFKDLTSDNATRYKVSELKTVVQKALDGKKLAKKQQRVVNAMIGHIDEINPELAQTVREDAAIDAVLSGEVTPQPAVTEAEFFGDKSTGAETRLVETEAAVAFDRAAATTDPSGETDAKGVAEFQGVSIALESPKGTMRSGVTPDGAEWETVLQDDYGEIEDTKGADGDPVDAFVGTNYDSDKVFVVDQIVPKTGKFDEHKVIFGAEVQEQAENIYTRNYDKNWKGLGAITEMSMKEFKTWVAEPKNTVKPLAPIPAMETAKQTAKVKEVEQMPLPKQDFSGIMITNKVVDAKGVSGVETRSAQMLWNRTQNRRTIAEQIRACVK